MSGQELRDRKAHVEAVCAEFGYVASEREMELLVSSLLPQESVLVVASGILPLDLEQPDQSGIGVAVATDRRVLFLRHGKSDGQVSIELRPDAIESVVSKAEGSYAEMVFQLREGDAVIVSDIVPDWAASRFADVVTAHIASVGGAKGREKAASRFAGGADGAETSRWIDERNHSSGLDGSAEPAQKKKRGCFATGLIVIGVIFGLLIVLLVLVGIFVDVPEDDSPDPTAVRRHPTVERIPLTAELRDSVSEMWVAVELQVIVGPPIAEDLCIEWEASEEFWKRVEERARDLIFLNFDPLCPLDVSYAASGGSAREQAWDLMEAARVAQDRIKEIEERLNELEEIMCLTNRGDYKARADRVIERLQVYERRGSYTPC